MPKNAFRASPKAVAVVDVKSAIVSKTWRRGLPTVEGTYLMVNGRGEEPQIIRAVNVANQTRIFSHAGVELRSGSDVLTFGPIPSPSRSFTAGRRKDRDTAPMQLVAFP